MYFSLVISSIYFFSVSLRFLNLPSDDTVFCSLSMRAFVFKTQRSCSVFVEGVRFIQSRSLRSGYPPVCTLWPRSSSACRWRSGWEQKWSPALRYNCWGSDRYQPLLATFLWSWPWSPHQCGSLSETPPGYSSVVRGWKGPSVIYSHVKKIEEKKYSTQHHRKAVLHSLHHFPTIRKLNLSHAHIVWSNLMLQQKAMAVI